METFRLRPPKPVGAFCGVWLGDYSVQEEVSSLGVFAEGLDDRVSGSLQRMFMHYLEMDMLPTRISPGCVIF